MRQIKGRGSARTAETWMFAILWCVLLIAAAVHVQTAQSDKRFLGLLIVMALAWPFLLGSAIIQTRRRRRHGDLALTLFTDWAIGERAQGRIDLRIPFVAGKSACVNLTCMHHYVRLNQVGDDDPAGSETLWETNFVTPFEPTPDGSRIELDFVFPAGLRASETYAEGRFEWWLRVQAQSPGVDLDELFVVPVKAAPVAQ